MIIYSGKEKTPQLFTTKLFLFWFGVRAINSVIWVYFFKMWSFFKKTTRRRQYHQSKLNLGDYPVAYADYPVAYVDYPVAYVESKKNI